MSGRVRTWIVLVAASASAALLWLAWEAHRGRVAIESRLVAIHAQRGKLELALRDARKTTVQRSAVANSTAEPSTAASAPPKTIGRKNTPSLMDLAQDHPEILNYFLASQTAQMQQRYGALFQQLGLTPDQREKFKQIRAAGLERGLDIGAALHDQGLTDNDPAAQKLRADSDRQTEKELNALLGDAGFQSYREFDRTISVRGFVDGFAEQMAETEPLTGIQAEQLVQALIAAGLRRPDGSIDPATLNWTEVDRTAQTFLTPMQFAAWKLGIAHNPAGGSRADQELRKLYDAIVAKTAPPKS